MRTTTTTSTGNHDDVAYLRHIQSVHFVDRLD